jgi:uncharacterized protein
MTDIILQKLKDIESKYNVTIIYACETGSRAWGFPSPDSDYDVRFIYALKDYMTIAESRDVIEYQVDATWDITGWELRKALRLFRGTNSAMIERLCSPIIYSEIGDFHTQLINLAPQYYSPKAGMHHYLSMTRNIFDNDLQTETVRLKKYFYALRTSLAALWIAKNQTAPPMTLAELRVNMPHDLNPIVDDLLIQKSVSNEKSDVQKISILHDFIHQNIIHCQAITPQLKDTQSDKTELDIFFKKILSQI